jgi:hypothetical protein
MVDRARQALFGVTPRPVSDAAPVCSGVADDSFGVSAVVIDPEGPSPSILVMSTTRWPTPEPVNRRRARYAGEASRCQTSQNRTSPRCRAITGRRARLRQTS